MKAKTPSQIIDLSRFVRTDKPHISNSYLSTLKRALIGEPQWFGTEKFLEFGTEHHKRALQPKEQITLLTEKDDLCNSMATSFRKDPKVKKILQGAKTEVEVKRYYRGALVLLYLDIYRSPDAWDLKGTSCESEREFLKSARGYDYFRQAALYQGVCKLKSFTFIGEGKTPELDDKLNPYHPLYFLPAMDYPLYLEEGREELHQLIDIHIQLRKYYESKKAA